MIPELPNLQMPPWLINLANLDNLVLPEILAGSAYYPACGLDGQVVRFASGYCHSFIYADYGMQESDVLAALSAANAFSGYELLNYRQLRQDEWMPALPINLDIKPHTDGDPNIERRHRKSPYAIWAIFQRKSEFSESHGPARFSLLYFCADGIELFLSLYYRYRTKPSLVAIIQPGEGFGFNWTNYYDSKQIFARTVLMNPYGCPSYLLVGGWSSENKQGKTGGRYRSPSWPTHSNLLKYWKTTNGRLGLWKAG